MFLIANYCAVWTVQEIRAMGCCVRAYICVSLLRVPFLVILGALPEVSVENDAYPENLGGVLNDEQAAVLWDSAE